MCFPPFFVFLGGVFSSKRHGIQGIHSNEALQREKKPKPRRQEATAFLVTKSTRSPLRKYQNPTGSFKVTYPGWGRGWGRGHDGYTDMKWTHNPPPGRAEVREPMLVCALCGSKNVDRVVLTSSGRSRAASTPFCTNLSKRS